jgi:catechol 2,3-dioxygenase-like lactoylglutathione lyase family enzyme
MQIKGLHHFAYRCRDAEETRKFYEDVFGLPLTHVIKMDYVPSTGEYCPYVHVFFQMEDGSYIAFFDLGDDVKPDPSPNTPAWVNHLALELDSERELATAKLAAHKNLTVLVDTMNLEDALCEVDTSCGKLRHGWLLYSGQ